MSLVLGLRTPIQVVIFLVFLLLLLRSSRSLNQFPAIGGAIDCGPQECDNALGGFG